uniref:Ig-like domain-containing protein n=1 Tax=Sinocyclocheilus rhinocerous TaxID=307959 RepID=A0A673GSC7_9TELE
MLLHGFCTFVSSCIYKAAGDKVVISFDDAKLQEDNELRWTHNKQRVYLKKGSQIKLNKLNVSEDGSLILETVQKDKSGEYKGIIYDAEGNLIKETIQQLCVLEPVPEPTVMVECVEKGVNLTCSAVNNDEVVVSWMKNGMKANVTHAVLHVSSSELKSGDNFSCTVSNKISKKSAKNVEPVCSDTGPKRFLFGLDLWWMLVILTGGGSFLLILFIICLVWVCRCCRRNKRKAKLTSSHPLLASYK